MMMTREGKRRAAFFYDKQVDDDDVVDDSWKSSVTLARELSRSGTRSALAARGRRERFACSMLMNTRTVTHINRTEPTK